MFGEHTWSESSVNTPDGSRPGFERVVNHQEPHDEWSPRDDCFRHQKSASVKWVKWVKDRSPTSRTLPYRATHPTTVVSPDRGSTLPRPSSPGR